MQPATKMDKYRIWRLETLPERPRLLTPAEHRCQRDWTKPKSSPFLPLPAPLAAAMAWTPILWAAQTASLSPQSPAQDCPDPSSPQLPKGSAFCTLSAPWAPGRYNTPASTSKLKEGTGIGMKGVWRTNISSWRKQGLRPTWSAQPRAEPSRAPPPSPFQPSLRLLCCRRYQGTRGPSGRPPYCLSRATGKLIPSVLPPILQGCQQPGALPAGTCRAGIGAKWAASS